MAKYFGPLLAGPKVAKLKPLPVKLNSEKRVAMTDRVGLSRLYLAWPTVPMFAADEAELEILADILANGMTARLHKALVREKQIAQDVEVCQESAELTGRFFIIATARQGHRLTEIEAAIQEGLQGIQTQPPTAEEIGRAVHRFEANVIHSLESASGFGGRADRLNLYNVFAGNPGYLADDFQRHLNVTPEAVQRVAGKYLGPARVVLEVTPGQTTTIKPDPRIVAERARTTRQDRA